MFAEILPNVFSPIVVEFTVRLAYAIFTVADAHVPGLRSPAAVARLGVGHRDQLRCGDRGLLVGGAVRRTRDRFAGRRSHPGVGVDRGSAGAMTTATEPMGSPGAEPTQADALAVDNIDVTYRVRGRQLVVVRDVSFRIARGESYGLVGESGCGKSTIALAVVRYLARNGSRRARARSRSTAATCWRCAEASCASCAPSTVSMVYQEPGQALNPTIRVGRQVAEVFEIAGLGKAESLDRAREMLEKVRISDPAGVMNRYPAPALGRHAAARRDRDGARRRAVAADPRRADDRAGRDGRGRGARPDLGAAHASSRRRCCSSATTSA